MPKYKLKTPALSAGRQMSKLKTLGFCKKDGAWSLEFGVWSFTSGFTLVELLVVISLMAIVGASVSATFLSFEKKQRLNEAASILKSSVRQAQNNALSGKTSCVSPDQLAGWYVRTVIGSGNLVLAGECISTSVFSGSIVKLPVGVTVSGISYGSVSISGTAAFVVFRPLAQGASFHTLQSFVDPATGDSVALLGVVPQDPLTVTLTSANGTSTVVVYPTGEVK